VSLYGFPTILYGTLLPSPIIGERCVGEIASVASAGHETGVHGWDHVAWHDRLDGWSPEKIREQSDRAHEADRRGRLIAKLPLPACRCSRARGNKPNVGRRRLARSSHRRIRPGRRRVRDARRCPLACR